jgi:predicted nuclease with RNAse H fold
VGRLRSPPPRAAHERQRQGPAPRYYEWIEHGLELYAALAAAGLAAIEAFPTASWTRWLGPRNGEPRARWSARALAAVRRHDLRLGGLPARLGQDGRDAVGAALTAYAYETGRCERYGDIVVPARAFA